MIRVQVYQNGRPIGDATSTGHSCFVGKDSESLVVLSGLRIGRRQLQLELREGDIHLTNGGGMAALKVNGTAMEEYGPVGADDVISLLDYEIRVSLAAKAAAPGGTVVPLPLAAVAAAPAAQPAEPAEAPAVVVERRQVARPGVDEVGECPLETPAGLEARAVLHKKLIAAMDLRRTDVAAMGDDELRATVRKMIEEIIENDAHFKPMYHWRSLLRDLVLNEVVGLGPLESLLADDTVTEIMVNRHDEIFVERKGRLIHSQVTFTNDTSVVKAIERIVTPLGRRIDESSPMVDARLKDGSRVNAVIAPVAIKGPTVTIRKFSKNKLTGEDLLKFGAINRAMLEFLRVAVEQRANIVISGGTGSGKTTLLNILSGFIPEHERIVTVEDAAELKLNQVHVVPLEARPANAEGRGEIKIRDLVKNCLRMRPDRIVVGECRGGETLDMLQAMNTGHDGSLTTAHANTPRDCLARLEVMTLQSGIEMPVHAIRNQICSAVNLIVQQTRFGCGSRRVTYIAEITGMENDIITMQDIFRFEQDGYGPDGLVRGRFVATGHVPDFYHQLASRGIAVDMSIFGVESLGAIARVG